MWHRQLISVGWWLLDVPLSRNMTAKGKSLSPKAKHQWSQSSRNGLRVGSGCGYGEPVSTRRLTSIFASMPKPLRLFCGSVVAIVCAAAPAPAHAASALEGLSLRWPWALPFAGLLLSIAVFPLVAPKFWHAHYGKIALFWARSPLTPLGALYGIPVALAAFMPCGARRIPGASSSCCSRSMSWPAAS